MTSMNKLFIACALLVGCGSDAEPGSLEATIYGESFIEDGIPAEEMADGWSVEFTLFEVRATNVTIGGVMLPDMPALDISVSTGGEGQALSSAMVDGGHYDGSSYTLSQVHATGSTTLGDVTKSFDWTFEAVTDYTGCETENSVDGDTSTFEITVHADHLFYDSLVAEEPAVVFAPLAAADSDEDGVITRAELEAADIGAYDPGSDDSVTNLWQYLEAQSSTLGHVNGEGHCDARAN